MAILEKKKNLKSKTNIPFQKEKRKLNTKPTKEIIKGLRKKR